MNISLKKRKDEKDICDGKGEFAIRWNNCDSLAFWIVLGH